VFITFKNNITSFFKTLIIMSSRQFWQQEAALMRDASAVLDISHLNIPIKETIDDSFNCKSAYNKIAGYFDKNANRWRGVTQHAAIQLDFWLNIDNGAQLEYQIPESGPNGGTGWADIIDAQSGIYEIKTYLEIETGKTELERYIDKGKIHCKKNFAKGLKYPSERVIIHPANPNKEIVAKGYKAEYQGMIIYDVRNRNVSDPIILPKNLFDKFKELKKKYEEDIDNIEREINEWLKKEPEVVKWIKVVGMVAAVTIMVATVIEDFITLGAGIADDVQSFYLARSIVRIAYSL
jgi:hypothetical protein